MRHLALLILLAGVPACDALVDDAPSVRGADGIRTTRSTELKGRLDGGMTPRILDVRTPREFASGHIPSAENVPIDELQARLDGLDLDRESEVWVICEGGARSLAASQVLARQGYLPVDVHDGMSGWRWKGFPTE